MNIFKKLTMLFSKKQDISSSLDAWASEMEKLVGNIPLPIGNGTNSINSGIGKITIHSQNVPVTYNISDTINIIRSDGTILNVGNILEALIDSGFIVPNKSLIEKSPALKEAYDEYQSQLLNALTPQLRNAIESYKFTENLVKGEQ